MNTTRALRATTLAAAALAAVHGAPVVSTFGPLRNRVMPRLCGRGRPDHVALTFDDGPDALSTPFFLRSLDRRGVRATFFMLGSAAHRAPGLVREIAAAGHEIGVHGWQHRPPAARPARHLRRLRPRPRHHRRDHRKPAHALAPPVRCHDHRRTHGGPAPGTHAGPVDLLGKDWTARATPESVHRTVVSSLDGGGTILLHDSDYTSAPGAWRAALGALPRILDTCGQQGYGVGRLCGHGWPGDTESHAVHPARGGASGH
ncbi:polysaccharide deacetylase family protein [Streptomyces sp. G-G2]|nr:polysaccharide deacetylase family protein [Streptomyces sp. G-G2]MDJ0383525.1 polysaccharide deacetylase family protein [Streptomyces sp. G-G2]